MTRFLTSLLLAVLGCTVGAAGLQMAANNVPGPGFLIGLAVLLGYCAARVDPR